MPIEVCEAPPWPVDLEARIDALEARIARIEVQRAAIAAGERPLACACGECSQEALRAEALRSLDDILENARGQIAKLKAPQN